MDWIDQLQQTLSQPVLAVVREYWALVLALLAILTWWFVFGFDRGPWRDAGVGIGADLTVGDGGDDGGGGGD